MKKRSLVLFLTLIFVLSMAFSVSAEKTYTLKYNHVLSPNHPFHTGLQNWAKRVEEKTDGNVQIEVYHSSQLGNLQDLTEQMRQGVGVGVNTDAAYLGNYVNDIAVMNGPYFVDSIEEVEKLRELPIVQKWMEQLEDKGLKVLSFNWVQGFRHFMTMKPVRKPADLDGLRVRTPPAPIWSKSVKSLGATPTALEFGQIYTSLQQGSVDGAELVYSNVTAGSLQEVLKYINETRHILLINFQVVSAEWFNSLPEEYQKILVEECEKAGLETANTLKQKHQDIRKQFMESDNIKIIPQEEVNIEAFREAGKAAYEELGLTEVRQKVYDQMENLEE